MEGGSTVQAYTQCSAAVRPAAVSTCPVPGVATGDGDTNEANAVAGGPAAGVDTLRFPPTATLWPKRTPTPSRRERGCRCHHLRALPLVVPSSASSHFGVGVLGELPYPIPTTAARTPKSQPIGPLAATSVVTIGDVLRRSARQVFDGMVLPSAALHRLVCEI